MLCNRRVTMPIEMNQLFDQVYKIPQVPEVVRNLIIQLNDPDFDMDVIAKNVTKDQVISMKVLRLVNSAHFGLSRKLASIEEAVVMLGMKQLKTLVIASGIVSSVPEIKDFDIKTFWSDSFRTATYAKWIADEIGADGETVFTAGLISDMGKLLIHMGEPSVAREIEQLVQVGNERSQVEEHQLGFTNAEICAELCRRWKFPESLVQTVGQSNEPLKFEDVSAESCIVSIAKYLSECRRDNLSIEDMMETFPVEVLGKLSLDQEQLTEKLPTLLETNSGLESLAA